MVCNSVFPQIRNSSSCRIIFTMNRFQQIKNPQTEDGGIDRGQ